MHIYIYIYIHIYMHIHRYINIHGTVCVAGGGGGGHSNKIKKWRRIPDIQQQFASIYFICIYIYLLGDYTPMGDMLERKFEILKKTVQFEFRDQCHVAKIPTFTLIRHGHLRLRSLSNRRNYSIVIFITSYNRSVIPFYGVSIANGRLHVDWRFL